MKLRNKQISFDLYRKPPLCACVHTQVAPPADDGRSLSHTKEYRSTSTCPHAYSKAVASTCRSYGRDSHGERAPIYSLPSTVRIVYYICELLLFPVQPAVAAPLRTAVDDTVCMLLLADQRFQASLHIRYTPHWLVNSSTRARTSPTPPTHPVLPLLLSHFPAGVASIASLVDETIEKWDWTMNVRREMGMHKSSSTYFVASCVAQKAGRVASIAFSESI